MIQSIPIYKLMILEMLNEMNSPLTNSQITEFMIKYRYAIYFEIQQTLSELSSSRLIITEHDNHSTSYHITEEGIQTLDYYRHLIPDSFIANIQTYFSDHNFNKTQSTIFASAEYEPAEDGKFLVRCRIFEKLKPIFEMTLSAPNAKTAEQICFNWENKQTELYSHVLAELLKTPPDK